MMREGIDGLMNGYTSIQPGQENVDLVVLQAMAKRLDDYLSRDKVYQPIAVETSRGTQWPTMSIGAMLARLSRLHALDDRLTPEQRRIREQVESEMERARRWYPEAYRAHAIREISSLVNSWRWFLDDCQTDIEKCADTYPAEARTRTTIQLLIDHIGSDQVPAELLDQVWALDDRLRRRFREGDFIWPAELAAVFPKDRFWWLYGTPAM